MSPCLPEIYAQSYKDEQNLEIGCLCINSNTKVLEKEIGNKLPEVRFAPPITAGGSVKSLPVV